MPPRAANRNSDRPPDLCCPDREAAIRSYLPAFAAITAAAARTITTPAAATPLPFGASFVYVQGPAAEFHPIEGSDCRLRFSVVGHLDEAKASWLSGVTVGDDADTVNSSVSLKQLADGLFGGPKTEVPNKNVCHLVSYSDLKAANFGERRTSVRRRRILP